MKALLLILALFAVPALADDDKFRPTKPPGPDVCAPALADGIKRTDRADGAVVVTYTAGGRNCAVVAASGIAASGVPNRIELGRLKTIAGHSGKPAK